MPRINIIQQFLTCLIFFKAECTKADIGFLLDESGSVGRNNFEKEKHFVQNFVNALPIGPNNVQVSVVTYASAIYWQFKLNSFQNKQSLLKSIAYIPYTAGGTNTGGALAFSAHELFSPHNGDRYGVPDILIVITDGKSQNQFETANAANQIHHMNIKTFAIGVGNGLDFHELNFIASDPQHVFTVNDFSALYTLQNELRAMACRGG